jgi:hypothetical protein
VRSAKNNLGHGCTVGLVETRGKIGSALAADYLIREMRGANMFFFLGAALAQRLRR